MATMYPTPYPSASQGFPTQATIMPGYPPVQAINYGTYPVKDFNYGGTGYPAKSGFMRAGPRQPPNFTAMVMSLFVPWILFAFLFTVLSFSVHYQAPNLAGVLTVCCFGIALLFGYFAYAVVKRGGSSPAWYGFIFATSLLACIVATIWGSVNFTTNMLPYYDVVNLNTYPSVDPQQFKGQQLMDMGRIIFTQDSYLDLSKSMGFRNLDVYCVAPIVSGNGSMSSYDFWAVGMNCCSGHASDFACGEYNNPLAHSGLRLMRDDLRQYFRLAVQQAEAAYNMPANHPIFLYWMQDPQAEVSAYQDAGYKQYLLAIGLYFGVQLLLVVIGGIAISKAGL